VVCANASYLIDTIHPFSANRWTPRFAIAAWTSDIDTIGTRPIATPLINLTQRTPVSAKDKSCPIATVKAAILNTLVTMSRITGTANLERRRSERFAVYGHIIYHQNEGYGLSMMFNVALLSLSASCGRKAG